MFYSVIDCTTKRLTLYCLTKQNGVRLIDVLDLVMKKIQSRVILICKTYNIRENVNISLTDSFTKLCGKTSPANETQYRDY